jgi:glycosyltransferase 2 family protein
MQGAPIDRGPEKPASRSFARRHGVKLVTSLVIAVLFALALRRGGLPIVPPRATLAKVSLGTCAVYTLMFLGVHTVRATRWRHLLAPIASVPLRRLIAVSWIGFAAILIMPLRAGEFVRPYMIRQRGKISIAAATGTIGAERIIDGLFLTVVLGICLQIARPLSPLPDHIGKLQIPVAAVPFYAYLALFGFLALFALMALFYWRPVIGRATVERSLGIFSKRLAGLCADFVARTAEGLKFLPNVRHTGLFFLETAVYWNLNALSMWVLARGCGIGDITFVQAWAVMGVLGVGILVPAGPGLFGAFQASTYAGLAMYFHDDVVLGPGAAYVFTIYVIQALLHVVLAGFFLLIDKNAAKEVISAETAGPETVP